jgi:formylmethanofuran dehydrogenase subunit A
MNNLIVRNGLVFDPINKIEGEKKDILIENGVIVEKFTNKKEIKEINANGKTVIPSGIDIHSHIASQQLNWVKLIAEKNTHFQNYWLNLTLENIARNYLSNGYTFCLEANTFPSLAKQTIFNFKNIPVLDKAMLLNVSSLWPLELEYQRGKIEEISVFLSDLLANTKAFGLKAYNPFESEDWDFKVLREDITKNGRLYNFSALDVYENLVKTNERLGLPHSLHAHIEGYETFQAKKNLFIILDKIKSLNLKPSPNTTNLIKRNQILHLAHASAYNLDGNNKELINFLNDNPNIDLDLGFIGFDEVNPLITSDRRLINEIIKNDTLNNNYKLIRSAIESEGDYFAILRKFDKQKKSHCILWANALDLAFNLKNKWQIQLTVNFPNYSHINNIPQICTLLLSDIARKDFLTNMSKDFTKNTEIFTDIPSITFNEFVIISRASPAVSLGIGNIKGNLGVGADGDINIIDINVKNMDISKDYKILHSALSNIEYVIKSGEVIKKKEDINLNPQGKIFWAEGKVDETNKIVIMNKKKEYYTKFGSTFYDTFKVSIDTNSLRHII